MDSTTPCALCGRARRVAFAIEDYGDRQVCDGCSRRVARLLLSLPAHELGQLWPSASELDPGTQRLFREARSLPARGSFFDSREANRFGVASLVRVAEVISGVGLGARYRRLLRELGPGLGGRLLPSGNDPSGPVRASALPEEDGRPYALLGAARALLTLDGSRDQRSRAVNLLLCRELAVPDILTRLRGLAFPV